MDFMDFNILLFSLERCEAKAHCGSSMPCGAVILQWSIWYGAWRLLPSLVLHISQGPDCRLLGGPKPPSRMLSSWHRVCVCYIFLRLVRLDQKAGLPASTEDHCLKRRNNISPALAPLLLLRKWQQRQEGSYFSTATACCSCQGSSTSFRHGYVI